MWAHPDLLRLNLGVFVLHTVQLSMWWRCQPCWYAGRAGQDQHWQVYLPAVVLSFVASGRPVCAGAPGPLACRPAGRHRPGAGVQGAGVLSASGAVPSLWVLGAAVLCSFCGFNALEASQPSLVSRMAPPRCGARRWAATTRCSRWACLLVGRWGRAGEVVGPRGLVCRHHCAHGPVAGRVLEAAARGVNEVGAGH